MIVKILLEGNSDFDGFDCRGRVKVMCDGCKLRFRCLSERDKVIIPQDVVKRHKIKNLESLCRYMFSEGRIPYEIGTHRRTTPSGKIETKIIMRVKV